MSGFQELVNCVYKDEQARRIVKSLLLDERYRNMALSWIGLAPEPHYDSPYYSLMILKEWQDKLAKE